MGHAGLTGIRRWTTGQIGGGDFAGHHRQFADHDSRRLWVARQGVAELVLAFGLAERCTKRRPPGQLNPVAPTSDRCADLVGTWAGTGAGTGARGRP